MRVMKRLVGLVTVSVVGILTMVGVVASLADPAPQVSRAVAATTQPSPTAPTRLPQGVPILTYHHIRDADPARDEMGNRLSTSPAQFSRDLDWLISQGYHAINFRDLSGAIPDRPVMITFDDGYDDAVMAQAIVVAHHLTATFYIVPGFVGRPGYLSWEQVRSLRANGMDIGAHTMTHPELPMLPVDRQRQEIEQSLSILELQTGQRPITFAYPYGAYNSDTVNVARSAGVPFAVTTHGGLAGPADDPMLLPRLALNSQSNLPAVISGLH